MDLQALGGQQFFSLQPSKKHLSLENPAKRPPHHDAKRGWGVLLENPANHLCCGRDMDFENMSIGG